MQKIMKQYPIFICKKNRQDDPYCDDDGEVICNYPQYFPENFLDDKILSRSNFFTAG